MTPFVGMTASTTTSFHGGGCCIWFQWTFQLLGTYFRQWCRSPIFCVFFLLFMIRITTRPSIAIYHVCGGWHCGDGRSCRCYWMIRWMMGRWGVGGSSIAIRRSGGRTRIVEYIHGIVIIIPHRFPSLIEGMCPNVFCAHGGGGRGTNTTTNTTTCCCCCCCCCCVQWMIRW